MRDENLIDTFESLLARLSCREWSLLVYSSRGNHLRAAVYVRGILCVMHTCMIHVRMLKTQVVHVARACVYPWSLRGRRQLTNCQTSYESLFKRLRRESSAAGRMKGERRHLYDPISDKSGLAHGSNFSYNTNERNSTLHLVFHIDSTREWDYRTKLH